MGVVALAALVLVFFWRVLLAGETLAPGRQQWLMEPWRSELAVQRRPLGRQWDALLWDAMAQYVPWRMYTARTLRSGTVPLWNPHQFCGTPFVANAQSAVLYPPNVLFVFIDPLRALGISAALHLLFAGACTYLLLRHIALQAAPALLGAVSFMFGGFLVTWTELPSLMNTAAWLPCCLLAAHAFFARPRWGAAALLAGALAMAFLAGHPQIFAYVAGTTLMYCIARLAKLLARKGGRPAGTAAANLMAAGLLVTLLCAAQALPTTELVQRGHRGLRAPSDSMWQAQVQRALTLAELPGLLVPDVHGSPATGTYVGLSYTEHCGFVGCVVLALALAAPFVRFSGHALFFAALSLGSILVATATPLARVLFFALPGFGAAGSVTRTLCVFTFSTAVLGAMGLQGALNAQIEPGGGGIRRRATAAVVTFMGVAALASWLVLRPAGVTAAGGLGAWWSGLLPLVAACVTGALLWLRPGRVPAATIGTIVVVLTLAELFNYGARFNPTAPRTGVYASVSAIETLRREQGDARILAITRRADWRLFALPGTVLPPNSAMAYGLRSLQGYDSLSTARYRGYAYVMEGEQPSPIANGNMVLLESVDSPLLDRAAVGLVMSDRPLLNEHLEILWVNGNVRIYRNRRALPRAYAAAGAIGVAGSGAALGALRELRPQAPPAPVVQHLAGPAAVRRPEAVQRPPVQPVPVIADEPNAVRIRLAEPAAPWARWLVLADAAYPGWRCYVSGERRPILPADYLFRAVELRQPGDEPTNERGAGEAHFVYFPQCFVVGAFLSGLGLAVLAATMVWRVAGKRARARGGEA